jgi:peptide/nickel transport system substrate-binding protein
MAARIRPHRTRFTIAALALLLASAALATLARVQAADTPRHGGILLAVIGAEPPSLDPHQEGTFANIQLVAPCYSTLLQFDPLNFSKIIGDVATEWKIAPDGRTYTFKIRPGSGSTTARR